MKKTIIRLTSILAIIITLMLSINILSASAIGVTYTAMEVPTYLNTSFKSYEPVSAISKSSTQGRFISTWSWVDDNGFVRCGGERDFGIEDDYYLVAMGSYYGTEIGTKYKVTTDTGNVFYVALGDQKDNRDTNGTNQYGVNNNDIIEFIVNTRSLNSLVKSAGSANVLMHLNGNIASVEKITFNFD